MPPAAPQVSVVIPTFNAGPRFVDTLWALMDQEVMEPFELVVIDSGSTDGTLHRAYSFGAKILRIPPNKFNHGRARNLAIAQCRGKYVALLVQDAIPANVHWLPKLVAALESSPHVAGAYSRHLPHEGAGFIARQVAEYWHRRQGGRVVQHLPAPEVWAGLPLAAKQEYCTFNNVSSIIRRSVWERIPFREVPFAEDLAWGYDVLRAGYNIIYEPSSLVYHSHQRPLWYELRRAYVEAKTVGELFEEPAQPLAVRDLWRLYRWWRELDQATRPLLRQQEVEPALRRQALEEEAWYRRHFSWQTLTRIFGGASPYPSAEQSHLFKRLNFLWHQKHPETNLPEDWEWGELKQHIQRAVWHGDGQALTPEEVEFIFACFWRELGRDYVRRAVQEEVAHLDGGFPALEAETRQFAGAWVVQAQQQGVLTPPLYREIWLYAATRMIGRRLGAANRYGAGGRWGYVLDTWWARGI